MGIPGHGVLCPYVYLLGSVCTSSGSLALVSPSELPMLEWPLCTPASHTPWPPAPSWAQLWPFCPSRITEGRDVTAELGRLINARTAYAGASPLTVGKDQSLVEHTDLVAHWRQLFPTSLFSTIQGTAGDSGKSQVCAHTQPVWLYPVQPQMGFMSMKLRGTAGRKRAGLGEA